MSDVIERQSLLKEMCRQCNIKSENEPCEPSGCFIHNTILNTPTVVPNFTVHAVWIEGNLIVMTYEYAGEKKTVKFNF